MSELTLKGLVDEYVKWDRLLSEAKKEIEAIKGKLQEKALEDMENRKVKQVEYWGSGNGKAVVTTSESVKLISYTYLQKVLGDILKDFVKETTDYKMSEHFKRVMTAIFEGDYVEQSVSEVLAQIDVDEKTRKTLKKKVKGNYLKDVAALEIIGGLKPEDAEHYAYFIQEAAAYEKIVYMLETAGYKKGSDEFQAALDALRHAVIVEEGIKIGVEYSDEDSGK